MCYNIKLLLLMDLKKPNCPSFKIRLLLKELLLYFGKSMPKCLPRLFIYKLTRKYTKHYSDKCRKIIIEDMIS